MRLVIVCVCLWTSAWPGPALAASGAGFSGRVEDARTGDPMAGAEVTIVGETGSVRTDLSGRFTWPGDVRARIKATWE